MAAGALEVEITVFMAVSLLVKLLLKSSAHSPLPGCGLDSTLLPTERRSQACSGRMHQARGTPSAFVGTVAARSPFVIKAGSADMEKGSGEYPASAQAYA